MLFYFFVSFFPLHLSLGKPVKQKDHVSRKVAAAAAELTCDHTHLNPKKAHHRALVRPLYNKLDVL